MAFNRTPPLEERIKTIRADIDAFIDARVAVIKKECPNLPEGVIRNTLTRGACQCSQYLQLKKLDDETSAREAAAKETAA
jgi:hypothetical protein